MSEAEFFTCACGNDRFVGARRLFFVSLQDGVKQRNWAADPNNSSVIVCTRCMTEYVWNVSTHQYDRVLPTP